MTPTCPCPNPRTPDKGAPARPKEFTMPEAFPCQRFTKSWWSTRDMSLPNANQPPTREPITRQPTMGQPTTRQPSTGQSATRQPATGQPPSHRSSARRIPATLHSVHRRVRRTLDRLVLRPTAVEHTLRRRLRSLLDHLPHRVAGNNPTGHTDTGEPTNQPTSEPTKGGAPSPRPTNARPSLRSRPGLRSRLGLRSCRSLRSRLTLRSCLDLRSRLSARSRANARSHLARRRHPAPRSRPSRPYRLYRRFQRRARRLLRRLLHRLPHLLRLAAGSGPNDPTTSTSPHLTAHHRFPRPLRRLLAHLPRHPSGDRPAATNRPPLALVRDLWRVGP